MLGVERQRPQSNGSHVPIYILLMRLTCLSFQYHIAVVVSCGMLEIPVNGKIAFSDGTAIGSDANYSCNPGFNLAADENAIRTCQIDGSWSASASTCQSKSMIMGIAC